MAYDFIAIGGATRDVSFFTDQGVLINNPKDVLRQRLLGFEYGAKIKVDHFFYSYGGGAANAAVNLAHFGLKAACLASVGEDEGGRLIRQNLVKRGVSPVLVKTLKGEESGASFILITPAGERIIFGARGANRFLKITPADKRILSRAKYIYLASLSGPWQDDLKKIFSLAGRRRGPKIFWNPGAHQYQAGLKRIAPYLFKTTVFALNKDEAIEIVLSSAKHKQLSRAFLNNPVNLAKIIKSFGPEIVLITLGQAGVLAYDGQKIYRQKIRPDKKRVDTTGIGDIFNSSFAAGLELYRGDINRAIRLGLLNTASKIAHLGAQNGLMPFRKGQKI